MQLTQKNFWQNKKVLITGHTGFKGSWLTLWLKTLGAEICGVALDPPTSPSMFEVVGLNSNIRHEVADIRNLDILRRIMDQFKPEIIIHMAAQPLVRFSYISPIETYQTNVIGTANVLEASRFCGSVRAIVSVTTDKCYDNKEWAWGYREQDPLGGFDPYSSSKACAELVSSAYRNSFLTNAGIGLATARAGNVIGGGDWAVDRLIPDILTALENKIPATIRNPNSIRPWQHVLEPLSGYLLLAEALYHEPDKMAEAWNFGPTDEDAKPVSWIADQLCASWGDQSRWIADVGDHPHEATYLKLDISKVKQRLNWFPQWTLQRSLESIVDWHKSWLGGGDMHKITIKQIEEFRNLK